MSHLAAPKQLLRTISALRIEMIMIGRWDAAAIALVSANLRSIPRSRYPSAITSCRTNPLLTSIDLHSFCPRFLRVLIWRRNKLRIALLVIPVSTVLSSLHHSWFSTDYTEIGLAISFHHSRHRGHLLKPNVIPVLLAQSIIPTTNSIRLNGCRSNLPRTLLRVIVLRRTKQIVPFLNECLYQSHFTCPFR